MPARHLRTCCPPQPAALEGATHNSGQVEPAHNGFASEQAKGMLRSGLMRNKAAGNVGSLPCFCVVLLGAHRFPRVKVGTVAHIRSGKSRCIAGAQHTHVDVFTKHVGFDHQLTLAVTGHHQSPAHYGASRKFAESD